jgi:hypothetical protein
MTGRGEGYCAFVLPAPGTRGTAYGYAGLAGIPTRLNRPAGMPGPVGFGILRRTATVFRPRLGAWFRRWAGRGRGWGHWARARRW